MKPSRKYLLARQFCMTLERVTMFFTGYFLPTDINKSIVLLVASLLFHLAEYEFEFRYHIEIEKEFQAKLK
jgi:hypothetical protein